MKYILLLLLTCTIVQGQGIDKSIPMGCDWTDEYDTVKCEIAMLYEVHDRFFMGVEYKELRVIDGYTVKQKYDGYATDWVDIAYLDEYKNKIDGTKVWGIK